jgi:bacillithiol biosynthesis deacetylase BshB1
MSRLVDILAIGAHPDDIEIACSGTIIKEVNNGKKVGLIDLTRGELGTRGSGELRLKEAEASLQILGAEYRINLGFKDGFFSHNQEHLRPLIEAIRASKARIVFANALHDRHPDHGRAGRLIAEACFLAGLPKVETEVDGVTQEAHRPALVLHYNQDRLLKPDICIDITEQIEMKMKAILAFKSQFYDSTSEEPETEISSKHFLDFIKGRAIEFGRPIGAKYAEGFQCERYLGIKSPFDLL